MEWSDGGRGEVNTAPLRIGPTRPIRPVCWPSSMTAGAWSCRLPSPTRSSASCRRPHRFAPRPPDELGDPAEADSALTALVAELDAA